jgi:YVTN family beta-propeller protein
MLLRSLNLKFSYVQAGNHPGGPASNRERVGLLALHCCAPGACAALLLLGWPLRGYSQTPVATVGAGTVPIAVAVNPVTNKIYVANNRSDDVTVIDGAANTTATVAVGAGPAAVAVDPVTNKIYVANIGAGNVTVIDGATDSTVTVPVGGLPSAVAVNPVTNTIYVANAGGNNVTVIDGATNTTTTVAAGTYPFAVAVNPVTNKIYVANQISNNVTVIDGATNTTTTVTVGTTPYAVAVDPVTNKIYVANEISSDATVIDGATNTTTTVSAGTEPNAVAVNPVTNKIYVANRGDTVTVIDGATNTTTPVATGIGSGVVAVNPVTNKIYVAHVSTANVTVIDGATNATTTVAAGTDPAAVAVNPVTNKIYVTNEISNDVTVIDGATNTTATVAAGTLPYAVAVNPVTNKIYVANHDSNDVTVIDEATNMTITVTVGTTPFAVAVNPVTNTIYVSNLNSANVTVIDGATNVTTTVTVGTSPIAVAVNPVTNKVYVSNLNSANVTVIDGATNVTTTVTAGAGPDAVAVNPVTNTIYVSNFTSGDVTVLSEQQVQLVPLATTISPLAGNETASPTPTFSFLASSSFAPTTPPANALYFQFDTWQGPWASATSAGGGRFSGTAQALSQGTHILYAYATDGQDASSALATNGNGSGSSPLIGNIAAYLFLKKRATSTTTLVSSLNPEVGGQSVTFTATVTSTAGGTPTGTVTFFNGTTLLGTGALNAGGMTTYATTALAIGSKSITATYGGDANYVTSTSLPVIETVIVAGFAPVSSTTPVIAGQSVIINLTLLAAPGSNLTFTLGCSGLPLKSSCSFSPNPAAGLPPPNGTAIQLTFSTSNSDLPASPSNRSPWPWGLPEISAVLAALFAAAMIQLRRAPRRRLAFGFCLAVVVLATVLIGCSAGGSSSSAYTGTPKVPATFTITGISGTTTISTPVKVTVQ